MREPVHGFIGAEEAAKIYGKQPSDQSGPHAYQERDQQGLAGGVGGLIQWLDPKAFAAIPEKVWKTDWVVHIKSVGDGGKALKYLARYIYRVALTDSAILHHNETSVTFRYRKADTGKSASMTLPVFHFLHRFLQHVLPKGFVKVRYYGLHHAAHRQTLALARAALYLHLKQPLPPPPPSPAPKPPHCCPVCKNPMMPGQQFRPGQLPYSHAPP